MAAYSLATSLEVDSIQQLAGFRQLQSRHKAATLRQSAQTELACNDRQKAAKTEFLLYLSGYKTSDYGN